MAMTNIIINGDFENHFDNWTGGGNNDNEIGSHDPLDPPTWTEDTYLNNGNTGNTVAEMDGNAGQTTVLEQSFVINDGPFTTSIDFEAALRVGATPGDGFTVEILDSLGNVVVTDTITPTLNELTGHSVPVTFPAAGTYTLRFTEIGDDDSIGTLLDDISILTCFTRGTRIETKAGDVLIEDLQVGDLVRTADHGFQPIRWIGSTSRSAKADMAPILIRKGALGNANDIRVSPNHRMLLSGWQAEMLFDEAEVLVSAKQLVNDSTILRVEGGNVEYFHMMFDQHEIVFSEGTPSESFFPVLQALDGVEQEVKAEILSLFPELENGTTSYGPPARPSLLAHEAAFLAG